MTRHEHYDNGTLVETLTLDEPTPVDGVTATTAERLDALEARVDAAAALAEHANATAQDVAAAMKPPRGDETSR